MYIYIIYQKRKRSKTPTEACVVGAQSNEEKCVFCVFEGTRKSTKKKRPRAGREEEGAIFLKNKGKKSIKNSSKNSSSHSLTLTHQLLFPPRGGALHYILLYQTREDIRNIHTHTHTHTL
jgi:hypothetical protein